MDSALLQVTLQRLGQQLIETHGEFEETVMLGLQPRGVFLGNRIKSILDQELNKPIPLGYLDTTFHRDDFRRHKNLIKSNATKVPFIIEGKKVILIDDVLYTGRTIRAAMDAMITFGRPAMVDLLILINRVHSRELPINPDYIGKNVNTHHSQRVLVEWREQGAATDKIWLIEKAG